VKKIEAETRHDVKAIEYYLKAQLALHPELSPYSEFVHFGCTSDDINNLAYAKMLQAARDTVILPALDKLLDTLQTKASEWSALPLLARTHGQPAVPTTLGKEIAVYAYRLNKQIASLKSVPIAGKCNGAVGNFNAHVLAYPEVDWPSFAKKFVESFGFSYQAETTQIEPHDDLAAFFHAMTRINNILIDLARDAWLYISQGYFEQRQDPNAVGSSTMPHKVNPIQFENAEGNAALANALLTFLADYLTKSRLQRDLVDSTLLRNIGVAIGHSVLAWQQLLAGLATLSPDTAALKAALNDHWEILTEGVQTLLRREGAELPYETLKAFSRGKKISEADYLAFVENLSVSDAVKKQLLSLTPESYVGWRLLG